MLVVPGWRYWAGGRLGEVGAVAGEGVEAVAIGSDCWAGCGGLYKLGCRSSLALVNGEGEASRACMGGAYADRAYADGACIGGACTGGVCTGGACTDGACVDGACVDGACADGAYMGRACADEA